jgi:hypothetical protein
VGADERLLQHRTTPVTVDLWVDYILLDVLDHPDIYDDAYDELDRREDEVPAPDNVDATPPPGFEWLDERDEHGLPSVVGRSGEGLGRRNAQRRTERPPSHTWRASGATSSGSHCGTSRSARCAASGRLGAYAENLTRAITAKLEQLDLNVPVNVTIGLAPHGADLRYGTTPLPGENYSRINDAIAAAIAATPGPATLPGTPLKRAERLDV